MKKILFLIMTILICMALRAQEKKEITIKAGTIVPLEAIYNVRAAQVHEGQSIDFKVSRDVVVDKVVAIPAGTIAKGTVYEAKRSAWFGTKGCLGIKVRHITLSSGDNVNFASSESVYNRRKSHSFVSCHILFYLCPTPMCL